MSFPTTPAKSSVVRCGSCMFYCDGCHPNKERPCIETGVRDYNPAPDCYTPTPILVARADLDFEYLGRLLRHLTADQLHVLGHLLTYSTALLDAGFKFGQPVFINLGEGEYLTNYFQGYVIGAGPVGDGSTHIYVASDLSLSAEAKPESRTLLRMMPDSLLTRKQFMKVRERINEGERWEAPMKEGYKVPLAQWLRMEEKPVIPSSEIDSYDPPTIDTAPSAWLDPFSVSELESFKRGERDRKKAKRNGLAAVSDPEADEKRKARAAKRLESAQRVVHEDGTVTYVIESSAESEAATPAQSIARPYDGPVYIDLQPALR